MLHVKGLGKQYPGFRLRDVSFSLEPGYIMGFVGVNGAGKTTTLKSILGMVRPDSGSVEIMGLDFAANEIALKQKIGVVLGDKDVYGTYRISRIAKVISRFYEEWDADAYARYSEQFRLEQEKKLSELSTGMQTKFFLSLALSHNAKLLILDEPTSGLDPAARDQLLEILQSLVEDGERSILYSTHITSDLEKCADFVTYIDDGEILYSDAKDDFVEAYRIVQGSADELTDQRKQVLIAERKHEFGFAALIHASDSAHFEGLALNRPTIEDIMIFYARRNA
jgi:ABC-2 type transport system ATP-binding protein